MLRGNIADVERTIIGLDHMVAGKRLAERWQLPAALRDCVWLHGQHPDPLPATVPQPRLVNLVTLADLLVLGPVGPADALGHALGHAVEPRPGASRAAGSGEPSGEDSGEAWGEGQPSHERQVWRVAASPGQTASLGVYDLGFDGGPDRWLLLRAQD